MHHFRLAGHAAARCRVALTAVRALAGGMSLPGGRVKATRGGFLSSILFYTPPPVFAEPEDCGVCVKDGKLLLVAAEREWAFELWLDAVFEDCVETVDGKPAPSLLCKFSKPGRRDDPTKLHFGSDAERATWKAALEKARDEAQRS